MNERARRGANAVKTAVILIGLSAVYVLMQWRDGL